MAILANQKVLTLDYWKLASKIQPGDYVFDLEGKPVKVSLVQEYRSERCYEVELNDYTSVAGDVNLGFLLENKKYRDRILEYKGIQKFRRPLMHKKVEELLNEPLRNKRNYSRLSIPTAKPLNFPHQTLPVPPFIFGFWFFNRWSNGKMCTPTGLADKIFEKFKDHGYKVLVKRKERFDRVVFTVSPTIESQLVPFLPTKIPENYLLSSAEQRLELLRGVLHSGSKNYSVKTDTFRFSSIIKRDVLQLQYLVESLGHKTKSIFKEGSKYYSLTFKSKLKLMDHQVSPPLKVHQARRYITKITPVQPQLCVHIETEDKNNSFLVGEGFISCR